MSSPPQKRRRIDQSQCQSHHCPSIAPDSQAHHSPPTISPSTSTLAATITAETPTRNGPEKGNLSHTQAPTPSNPNHTNNPEWHHHQNLDFTPSAPPTHSNSLNHSQGYSSPASIGGSLSGTGGGAFHSPAGGWSQDGFSQDPGFLASQEELRCILFSLAHSAVPTRVGSLSPGSDQHQHQHQHQRQRAHRYHDVVGESVDDDAKRHGGPHAEASLRAPVSSLKRIEYLKNYVAQVAPWVS